MFLRLGPVEWLMLIGGLVSIVSLGIHFAGRYNQPWKQDELKWRMFTVESELDDVKAKLK